MSIGNTFGILAAGTAMGALAGVAVAELDQYHVANDTVTAQECSETILNGGSLDCAGERVLVNLPDDESRIVVAHDSFAGVVVADRKSFAKSIIANSKELNGEPTSTLESATYGGVLGFAAMAIARTPRKFRATVPTKSQQTSAV